MTRLPHLQPENNASVLRAAAKRGIFLVGYMGAGKTSVGRALSKRLNWEFVDLDERIEAQEGRSIPDIFREFGEAGFRQVETRALRGLFATDNPSAKVIALGGGAFLQPENASFIESLKMATVFLDASPEELLRRCRGENRDRPLGRDEERFRQLYETRRVSYLSAACRVETQDKDVEMVAAEVSCSLGLE